MNDFKTVAMEAAIESGKLQIELSQRDLKFELKNPRDILAEGDTESEKIIIGKIKQNFPSHSIWSEEAGKEILDSEYLWVIDPIDGTISFARKIEDYCVSIALSHKGSIIFGLIYQPALNKMYIAEKGKGAFLNNEPISVSTESDLITTLAATDNTSKNDFQIKNFELLTRISTHVRQIRICGSVALHIARLAEGKLDLYFKNRFNYWDCAAGALILREAGGTVTDFDGKEFTQNSVNIVASNKIIHQSAIELIQKNLN
ncbi:MAG: inositol monophosphatase [bacterium]|nr:inositol monophosphatase [bacterium]